MSRNALFLAAWAGALCVCGCSSTPVPLPQNDSERRLVEKLNSDLQGTRVPVPAEPRFINFPEKLDVKPASFSLFFFRVGRGGETYSFPVAEALESTLKVALSSTFDPPDERQKPIRSDAYDVEFGVERCTLYHRGGPGASECELKLRCEVRLPNRYVVRRFNLETKHSGELGGPGAAGPASPLWEASATVARELVKLLRKEDLVRELGSYRTDEEVCSATGHKRDPQQPEGRFCPNHQGKEFVKRIDLRSSAP
jgi:hypothetical protein